MIRLLVADDEKYDRDSIITILTSAFEGQLEINEARNGREAIEISEQVRPDIIIMDIKMPGINGLKAIQEIKKFIPNAYFIILTAYDYFDFAVEAVKYNVKDYILKPFSKTELIERIETALNFVNTEKEKRRSEIENQEKLYTLMPMLENELSFSIINNSINSIDYETYKRYLNMDFDNTCSMVIQLIEKQEDENLRFQIGEYIKEYIGRRFKTITSYRFTKDLVYFVQFKNIEENETKFNSINLAAEIKREVRKSFNVSIKIGIGNCYSGLTQMYKSYKEACHSLEFKSDNNIIHYQDTDNRLIDKKLSGEKSQNGDGEKIALFKAVEQYIADNLNEELDLEKTASKFNLSPYYFSRTFKEILGNNFSDYVNIMRINKAKSLLKNSSMSIKEVCFSVGYSDPNYFSKVFKKYVGTTPTEYKVKLT